ncbi:Fe-S cluster protein [Desulfonema ishimotonii]|uniref:Fe-S cluster protein n=1 Tax=Desulfonema ishimotonii TaxID=45657 RepID=A0A401FSS0_9BACT|nr:(Fe-S)-binding protein [Desulfonema ishimotonii]GBC60008.1 Fe-S cluster protein [Desulfonema ishimotonii]
MLLKSYRKEIFRAECNPSFESVHCFAHLDQDVSEVIPYLNAELGGDQFARDPISVTFKNRGRLITVYARKIAVNALRDEEEADKILNWLRNQINETWANRDSIEPSYESAPSPKMIEILRLLPKTNCRECGQPTCMVFATQVVQGIKGVEDCPPLEDENRQKLRDYLRPFKIADYYE